MLQLRDTAERRDRTGVEHRFDQMMIKLTNAEVTRFWPHYDDGNDLEKQIQALTAGLQRVSAQLELSKPAQQTVLNNQ
jgi:hypothetical protein